MLKKFLATLLLITASSLAVQAYEDCMIFSSSKLTDINIENNTIVDVFPLVTIENKKNILIVHPLKTGKTRFCVLKDNKNLALFNVTVGKYSTIVNAPDGFEVLTVDFPGDNDDKILDKPPYLKE